MVFITEASVNMAADPELLELMVTAGFKKVFLGLETPNAESLRECRKVQNLRERPHRSGAAPSRPRVWK